MRAVKLCGRTFIPFQSVKRGPARIARTNPNLERSGSAAQLYMFFLEGHPHFSLCPRAENVEGPYQLLRAMRAMWAE